MEREQTNNPLGRLKIFAQKSREIDVNISIRVGWARLCNHSEDDLDAIFDDIKFFAHLIQEAKDGIKLLDGYNHDLYLRPVKRLEVILKNINLELTWGHITKFCDEQTIYELSVGSDILSKVSKELTLEDDEKISLLEKVTRLMEDLIESDLPVDIKAFLQEQLERFRNALINYRIFGETRILDVVEKSTGAFMIKSRKLMTVWDKPLVKGTFDVLTVLANIVAVKDGGAWVADKLIKLLGNGN